MNEGVNKWLSCKNAVAYGILVGDEAGYALHEAGFIENYGCEQPMIVGSGEYPLQILYESSKEVPIARLSRIGKISNEKVIFALRKSCATCPFYEEEEE